MAGRGCCEATPEMLAAMSIRSKALHEDPEYKAKMARVYADPEFKAKQKARYATPESREAARQQSLRTQKKVAINGWPAWGPKWSPRWRPTRPQKRPRKNTGPTNGRPRRPRCFVVRAAHQEKLAEWARTRPEREREASRRDLARKHALGVKKPMAQFQAERKARALVAEEARKVAQKARADAKKEATKVRAGKAARRGPPPSVLCARRPRPKECGSETGSPTTPCCFQIQQNIVFWATNLFVSVARTNFRAPPPPPFLG